MIECDMNREGDKVNDKISMNTLSFDEAEKIVLEELGYANFGEFLESNDLGNRSNASRWRNGKDMDRKISVIIQLMQLITAPTLTLKDVYGGKLVTSGTAGMLGPYLKGDLILHRIRDNLSEPAYHHGDVVLMSPFEEYDSVREGDWLISYQDTYAFGRLQIMPDGAFRFVRHAGATEPFVFGRQHEGIKLVGRAIYHLKNIGA